MTTFAALAAAFQSDDDSPYRNVEYASRKQYAKLCKRLVVDVGNRTIAATNARELRRWHQDWTEASGVPIAHALMSMLRMLTGFGATILEDADCQRVRGLLGLMRFPNGERRQVFLSFEQASALCNQARPEQPGLSLCQALQFETMARQKDGIGAWVPLSDRTPSDLIDGDHKWIKGGRWNEVDEHLIWRHRTSKKKKLLVADLKLAPLVINELRLIYPHFAATGSREALPETGPIIINVQTGLPFSENTYRWLWRKFADELGIPKGVQNRDSRSGGITEALAAGATPDDTRKMATHSQLSTTLIYSRDEASAMQRVAQKRIEARG